MNTAIVIMSDPVSRSEESLGRLANALAYAHEGRLAGDTVDIVFKGAGTRWPAELAQLSHPLNTRYQAVRESVKGVSLGCAVKFGAKDAAEACGLPLIADTALPGSPGLAGLRKYHAEGWNVVVF